MAIFSGKKNTKKEIVAKEVSSIPSAVSHADVILRPRVTEKSHNLAEVANVFIFDVAMGASKGKVEMAVKDLFKVSPLKVSIVPVPRKKRVVRGRVAYTGGGRKAYVYLKKGEKLETA
jgi:large subunit ribosomal protein L23